MADFNQWRNDALGHINTRTKSQEYDLHVAEAQVRDLDGIIQKLILRINKN